MVTGLSITEHTVLIVVIVVDCDVSDISRHPQVR